LDGNCSISLEQIRRAIAQALNQTCHNDLKYWEEENIPYTMQKKRQAFFSSGKA